MTVTFTESNPEYHSVTTITLYEWLECGALTKDDNETTGLLYGWDLFTDKQGQRVVDEIIGEYGWREVALTPVKGWLGLYRSKMQQVAQQANLLYPLIEVDTSELSGGGYKERTRHINSQFPQTMLSQSNSDYASSGDDEVKERVEQLNSLDIIETLKGIAEDLTCVDKLFIDAVDVLFLHTFAPIVNGF